VIDLVKYQTREYCKDIECDIQKLIDEGMKLAESFCRKDCEAYKFHKWLQENNYKIVRRIMMKIEDCEVGMKLECLEENYPNGFHKGDVLTVKEIINKAVRFEESRYTWNIYNFKPANKFEVGDEVIEKYLCSKSEKVRYCGEKSNGKPIIEYDNEFMTTTTYNKLSPLKNKDELEVGDKVVDFEGDTVKILCRTYDEQDKGIRYWVKGITRYKGGTWVMQPNEIDEIIYD